MCVLNRSTFGLLVFGRVGKVADQMRCTPVPVRKVLGTHGGCFVSDLATLGMLDARDDDRDTFLLVGTQTR
jgi:hypothetical protein